MMSDYSTAAAPSLPRRKSPISHTGGFTDLPSASGALNSEYNYEKDSSSSRKPIKRSERNRDRKRGKARDETKALQIYNKGSSSGLVVTKSDSTIQSTEQYEKKLATLRQDVAGLRTLITCKICDRLLYEPFVISCGHTFCYSCLCTWFVNNNKNKTCPDCRVPVVHAPAPSYLIREMTQLFIDRQDTLPLGDTQEQHLKWRAEEADAVYQDKSNTHPNTGGLFKGCFPTSGSRYPLHRIRDSLDGVDRCPRCTWEIEDDECYHCGARFRDFSDAEYFSELDGELGLIDADLQNEIDDYEGDEMDPWPGYSSTSSSASHVGQQRRQSRRRRAGNDMARRSRHSPRISLVSQDYFDNRGVGMSDDDDMDDEEDEEDEDSSMRDFVDDDSPSDTTSSSDLLPPRRLRPSPGSPPPSYEVEGRPTGSYIPHRNPENASLSDSSSTSSTDTDDDGDFDRGPIAHGRRQRRQDQARTRSHRLRRQRNIVSSENEQSSVVTDEVEDEEERPVSRSRNRHASRHNRWQHRVTDNQHESNRRRRRH